MTTLVRMTETSVTTTRSLTVAGLLAGVIGIAIAKAGGMDMPTVPPGAVLLVAAATLLVVFRGARWPAYLAVLIALAEAVPSALSLGGAEGSAEVAGTVIRLAGVLTALAGGLLLSVPSRARSLA